MPAIGGFISHGGSKNILFLTNFLIIKVGLQRLCLLIKFINLRFAYKGLRGKTFYCTTLA